MAEISETIPAAETKPDLDARLAAIINGWVVDKLHSSPLSQQVEAWNHLHASLPDLKQRLADFITKEP